jgi:hypothetical protein
VVGKSGKESSFRRAETFRDQQISRPKNLPGFGNFRTMKNNFNIVNLSGRGDKDVAQVADKVKLQMPK